MIHWLFLIPALALGVWVGSTLGNRTARGFIFGTVVTLLALVGLS